MVNKKGGYQMVNLATLTYALALAYLECDKPLLIYDGKNKPYYADSIEKVGDNVVIRKSGQTIVVDENDNVVNGVVASDVTTKKIYCHPITFGILPGGTPIACSCLIFNNDSTSFTWDTFKSYVTQLGSEYAARIILSGSAFENEQYIPVTYLNTNDGSITIVVQPGSIGESYKQYDLSSVWETLQAQIFNDGVNPIN